jgi:hypothetical protein
MPDAAPSPLSPPAPPRRGRAIPLVLLGLTGLGLALRVAGLAHGLPDIFHPDVPKQLVQIPRFLDGHWIPTHRYPMLHIYVAALGLKGLLFLVPHPVSLTETAVAVRLLNAFAMTAVIPLVFLIGVRLHDARVGLWAAALAALSSLHVLHAHYEMGEALHVLFVVAGLAAAVAAQRSGRVLHFCLAGVCAGLAGAAKLYGAGVLGALVVAALTGPRPERDGRGRFWRPAALLATAGVVAAATFTLATPAFLVDPAAWVRDYLGEDSPAAGPRLPDLAARPGLAARRLLGLSLDWLGAGVLGLALAGAVIVVKTRPPRGCLLLVTPILTLALYVAARANFLDDRNLVTLAPFVYLLAAAALGWASGRGRVLRGAALAAGIGVTGWAALDAVTLAHLFRMEDTRTVAARWSARHLPDSVAIARDEFVETEGGLREIRADALLVQSTRYSRFVEWHSARRSESVVRALELLEERGKLLKRFALLPRAFTSPTLAYYDLESAGVAHAFPPPDAVVDSEPLIFADDRAVPDRAAVAVPPRGSRTVTVVSRQPLARLGVALAGTGHGRVRQGGRRRTVGLGRGEVKVVQFAPRRSFPWYTHVYRVTIDAPADWTVARLLLTPCDTAWAYLAYERWSAAIGHLEACRGVPWVEPARLLDLAWAEIRLGRTDRARRALEELERTSPGLVGALAELVRQPDGPDWPERYRRLAGHGPGFWHAHTVPAVSQPGQGWPPAKVERSGPAVDGSAFFRAGPGTGPRHLKVWFPQDFLRGPLRVRFRLRGQPAGEAVARLDVVRHFQRRILDTPVARRYTPSAGGAFEEIELPVVLDLEPASLEARVFYDGRGEVEVDQVSVVPDVRAVLAAKLQALEPLMRPGGARPAPAARDP